MDFVQKSKSTQIHKIANNQVEKQLRFINRDTYISFNKLDNICHSINICLMLNENREKNTDQQQTLHVDSSWPKKKRNDF